MHLTNNPSEKYRHDFVRDLPRIIKTRRVDAVAILGDLTEEKDRHSAQLVNAVVEELAAIAEVCPLLAMMGNHDYRNEGHPFFAFVQRIKDITWVDKVGDASSSLPTPITRGIFQGCLFLPHTRNHERDWAVVKLPFKDYRFIFAHNTFDGSKTPAGKSLEGIPVSVFGKIANNKVIAGDVHTPQAVGPVTYVGAPYTVDFGDEFDPRMIEINGYTFSSISVKQWTQKRLLVLDDLNVWTKRMQDAKIKEGDIVKVRLHVKDMTDWASLHADILKLCNKLGVQLFRAEPIIEHKALRRQHRVRPEDVADDATIVKQYAKRHDIDAKTLAVGMELLK